ncbi:MAG: hypothetical protein OYH76_18795 [Defluviicoccus sp.]|nr:hypothetical protein [Defluviicoccus sp.]MDE0277947.1 hypothetical protein [Defluviicoccus sp.]
MDANLAGFVALGALMVGLFAWLRHDTQTLRRDMDSLRGEMRGEIGTLRGEIRNDIGTFRGEIRNDIGTFRGEMRDDIGTFRGEMRDDISALRDVIGTLGREMNELRERVARIEGLLEAVFMRRDLTPPPEPPPPAGPSGEPEAA